MPAYSCDFIVHTPSVDNVDKVDKVNTERKHFISNSSSFVSLTLGSKNNIFFHFVENKLWLEMVRESFQFCTHQNQ